MYFQVSDQICLNINVVVRSITQAAMVLVFMVSSNKTATAAELQK
jgi:hypothetical protein